MSGAPRVSVVTPVYDTADHLAECIESVLRQTFRDFDYVVVDNQSTDGSAEIAERYAREDPRVRVVRNREHLPQAPNYNHALRQIHPASTWCKMVQADDWITPDCLERMVALAERDPAIAMVGSYRLVGDDVAHVGLPCADPASLTTVLDGREACRMFLLRHRYLFGTPTTLLYRSDLVRSRERFFREDSRHEDSEVCFELLGGHRFGFVHQVLSFTRVEAGSMSGSVEDLDPVLLHRFLVTRRYGRLHLDEDEYRRTAALCERAVYRSLVEADPLARDPRRRRYREELFRSAGAEVDHAQLRRLQLRHLLARLGNPASSVLALARRLRARMAGNGDGAAHGARR